MAETLRRWRIPDPAALPLHPPLFAAASVLALYVTNLRETTFGDVAPTLLGATATALALLLAFTIALRSFGPRPAILASLVLLGGLHHLDLFHRANRLVGGPLPAFSAMPLALAVVALLAILVWRTRFKLLLPNALLNGIALVLFAGPVWTAVSHAWETRGLAQPAPAAEIARPPSPDGVTSTAKPKPDIFYFIFDRYGSERTLARIYGFDNRPFLDALRAKGFYVASASLANYPKTAPSLAATFHMDYLDFLEETPLARRNEWHPIYDMVREHEVGRFLKAQGYRFVQIGGWWAPTQFSPMADENYRSGFSEFAWLYLRRTIVPSILDAVAPRFPLARQLSWDNGQCQRVPRQLERIKASGGRAAPTFTFAHILLPHEPYVFDSDGRCLTAAEAQKRTQHEAYVAQVRYANRVIAEIVERLLGRREKPIIIVQADEGPYPEPYRTSNRSWTIATPDELAMKSAILNATYFPDGDYSMLDQEITPVNTFRLVFDKYFGTRYGRLPDRIFAFPDYSSIYDFFDVTELARHGNQPSATPVD